MTHSIKAPLSEFNFNLSLEPVDWSHLYLLAQLTPGQRMLGMAQTSAFTKSILRGSFRRRFPNQSLAEINMILLEYLQTMPEYIPSQESSHFLGLRPEKKVPAGQLTQRRFINYAYFTPG
jgi:hypothetical protein